MKYKKIYFVGIKGVGMATLATIAYQAGFKVGGSDINEEFITDSILKNHDIQIHTDFRSNDLQNFVGDTLRSEILIITTGAHGGFDNPQVQYAKYLGLEVVTHGQAVGIFMSGQIFNRKDIKGISVTGSHGKTTTSAMIATFLSVLGQNPSFTVGTSEIFPLGAAGHYGLGEYFVAEADEYISEMKYDRTPKLLYQNPYRALINNIDFDHPDFYKDIDHVEHVMSDFINNVLKKGGIVIANGEDSNLQKIIQKFDSKRIITFGINPYNQYFISDFKEHGLGSEFSINSHEGFIGRVKLSVPGAHNSLNSLGAACVLFSLGFSIEQIQIAFPQFLGSKRRIEYIGTTEYNVPVFDDYGHHPAEIKTTLQTLKSAFPEKKIVCIFQSHTLSRTQALIQDLVVSFDDCYQLIILPVFKSMREAENKALEEQIKANFKSYNKSSIFLNSASDVIKYIQDHYKNSDYIILTMGAGDVYKIAQKLKKS